jgi:hypothetical protein
MTWRRIYALLSHHYGFSIEQINSMTMVQVNLYLSQVKYVSAGDWIKSYLRAIYGIMLKWLCDTDLPEEYDEGEDESSALKEKCESVGIEPPGKIL